MNVYQEIDYFYNRYRGKKCVIGKSAFGRDLFAFFVGDDDGPTGICQYAMHAREWITAYLALEHISRGVRGGVWFLPLINPDGALLATEGIESVEDVAQRQFLIDCNGGEDFSLWKANGEAVDLNVNFPARWGGGIRNVCKPASAHYIGDFPLCAPETRALAEFTLRLSPDSTISWHTKGEEIYWRFHQPLLRAIRDKRLGKRLARVTGYPLREAPLSAGGYKDWCVETLEIPAYTVEAGNDDLSHPLGMDVLEELKVKCGNAVRAFTEGF